MAFDILVEDQLVAYNEVFEGVDNEIETVLGSIAVYIDNLPQRMLYI